MQDVGPAGIQSGFSDHEIAARRGLGLRGEKKTSQQARTMRTRPPRLLDDARSGAAIGDAVAASSSSKTAARRPSWFRSVLKQRGFPGDALLLQERASDEGERSDRAGIRSGKDLQATVLVPELQTRATDLPDEAPASSPLSPRRQCYEVVAPALLSRIEVLSSLNAAKRRPPAAGKMVTDSNLVQLERESTTRLRRILDRQFGREDGAQTAIGRAWKRFLRRRAFLRVVHMARPDDVVRWVQLRWRFRKRLREFRQRQKQDDFAGLIRALHASTAFRCGVIRRKHLLFRRSLSNLVGKLPVLSTAAYDAGAADQIQKACRLWLFRKRRRAAAVRLQTWFRYDVARRAAAQRGGLRVLFETAQVCVVHRQDSMQAYAGGFNFGLGPGSNGDEEEDLADADEEDAGPLGGGAASSSSGWSSSADADFIEGQRLLAELETSAGITVQRVFRTGAEYAQCLLESSESEASSVDEQAERRNRLYGGGGSKSRKEQLLRSGGGVSSMNFREAASRRGSRNAGGHGTASSALSSARGRPLKKQGSSSPATNSTNLWNKAGRSGGRGNHRDDEGVKTSARSAGRKTLVRGATGSSSRLGDGSFSLGESVTFSSSPKSRETKVEHSTQRNTAAKKRKTTIYADTTRTSSNSRSFSTDDEDEQEESLRRNTAWNEQRTQSTLFLADEDCGHSTSSSFTRNTKKFPRSLSFSPMKGGAAPRPGGFSAIKERDSHSRGSARRSSGASSLRSSARSSSGNADAHARGRESAERSSSGGRSSCDRGCGGGRDESKGFKKMKSVRIDEDENDYEPVRRSDGGGGSRPLSPSLREEQTPGTKPGSGRTSSATSRRGSWDIKQQASSSNYNSPVSQATSSFGSATSPRHQDGSRSPVQIVSDRELERLKERLREVPSMFAQLRPRRRQGDFWLSKVLDRDLTCSFTHREYKRNVFGGVHNKEEFLFPGYGAAAGRARSTYREDGGVPVGKRLGTVMHGQESGLGSLVPGSLSKRARGTTKPPSRAGKQKNRSKRSPRIPSSSPSGKKANANDASAGNNNVRSGAAVAEQAGKGSRRSRRSVHLSREQQKAAGGAGPDPPRSTATAPGDAINLRTSMGGTPTATRRNASRKTQFGQILSGQTPTGGTTAAAGGAIAAGGGAAAGAHDGNRFPVAYRQKQSKTIILFAEPEQCPRTVGEMRLQHGLFVPAAMGRLFFQSLLNCFFTGGSGTGRGAGTAGGAGGAPTLGGIGFFGSGGPKSPGGLSARGQYKGGGAGGHLSAHVMQVPRVYFLAREKEVSSTLARLHEEGGKEEPNLSRSRATGDDGRSSDRESFSDGSKCSRDHREPIDDRGSEDDAPVVVGGAGDRASTSSGSRRSSSGLEAIKKDDLVQAKGAGAKQQQVAVPPSCRSKAIEVPRADDLFVTAAGGTLTHAGLLVDGSSPSGPHKLQRFQRWQMQQLQRRGSVFRLERDEPGSKGALEEDDEESLVMSTRETAADGRELRKQQQGEVERIASLLYSDHADTLLLKPAVHSFSFDLAAPAGMDGGIMFVSL